MTTIHRAAARAAAAALLLFAAPAAGQVWEGDRPNLRNVQGIVDEFARDAARSATGSSEAAEAIYWIHTHPGEVPPAALQALLRGLERLVLASPNEEVRGAAVLELAAFATTTAGVPPRPGMLATLLRVYRQTEDEGVRSLIVGELRSAGEAPAAAAFLRQVAVQLPGEEDFPDAAERAVQSLSLLGAEGRETLRALHAGGEVRDPKAAHHLALLARHGFDGRALERATRGGRPGR